MYKQNEFEAWWRASKYQQVVNASHYEQAARDGWSAALETIRRPTSRAVEFQLGASCMFWNKIDSEQIIDAILHLATGGTPRILPSFDSGIPADAVEATKNMPPLEEGSVQGMTYIVTNSKTLPSASEGGTSQGITIPNVQQVEDKLGVFHNAWGTVTPTVLIATILSLAIDSRSCEKTPVSFANLNTGQCGRDAHTRLNDLEPLLQKYLSDLDRRLRNLET